MALDPRQKEKLDKLALDRGGVAFVGSRPRATSVPTIVISLGGLGGETLHKLKEKFVKNVDDQYGSVQFLAIDTEKKALRDKLIENGGYFKEPEIFGLFDPTIADILKNDEGDIPAHVRKWLAPGFPKVTLDDKGAQGKRQIGRVMLLAGSSYGSLEQKIGGYLDNAHKFNTDVIADPKNPIEIILIAGVSGGTGSGTIIDVSYLLHSVIKDKGLEAVTSVSAYVYTPDVQFGEVGIAGESNVISNLKKNGYAAFKEIDYFMNLTAHQGKYELDKGENNIYSSTKNIYDTVYVISGTAMVGRTSKLDAIETTTENLLDLLTDISYKDGADSHAMSKAFSSNRVGSLESWYNTKGASVVDFPRAANYRYQVLGYAAVSIPKQEILTYCVYRMFQEVQKEFKSIYNVDSAMVDDVLGYGNVLDFDQLVNFGLRLSDTPVNQNISINDSYLPTKKEVKEGTDKVRADAIEAADTEAWKVTTDQHKAIMASKITNAMKNRIQEIFDEYGPYYVVELLTHRIDHNIMEDDTRTPFVGVLEYLTNLKNEFLTRAREEYDYANSEGAARDIDILRDAVSGGMNPLSKRLPEIRAYADKVCEVAMASQFWGPYYDALAGVLGQVIEELKTENNQIWEVYTEVLDAVSEILEKDADYITNSTKHEHTYSYNVINLYDGDQKAKQLQEYLQDFASPTSIQALTDAFIKSMRDNREKWTVKNNMEAFHADVEVREIFDNILSGQLGNDIIEKFVVAAYSPKQLTPAALDNIWDNNLPGKQQAIDDAAKEIYGILQTKGSFLARMEVGYNESKFNVQKVVATLDETPLLAAALKKLFAAEKITDATSKGLTKYISSTIVYGLPLYVISGFKDFDAEYRYVTEDKTTVGIHMDEKAQDWKRFPQPYPLDIAARGGQDYKKFRDYRYLMEVKEKADKALDASLLPEDSGAHYGFIYLANPAHAYYTLDNITDEPADMRAFREFVKAKLEESENPDELTLRDFVTDAKSGYQTKSIALTFTEHDFDLKDLTGKDLGGKNVVVGDFYKMIRMSMYYIGLLEKNLESWERAEMVLEEVIKENIEKRRYAMNLRVFCNCLKTGLVMRDENFSNILKYKMTNATDILVDLRAQAPFDRDYVLYHAFAAFSKLDDRIIHDLGKRASALITGNEDITAIKENIAVALDENHLTYLFAKDEVREGVSTSIMDYTFTDNDAIKRDAYKVLLRFYQVLQKQF